MKKPLLASFLLSGLFSASGLPQATAQSRAKASAAEPAGYLPWFTLQNNALLIQNGSKTKPLEKDVLLPSGVRVEYRTKSVVLTNGRRVQLQEGDVLSLNGDYIPKTPPTAASAPPTASAEQPAPHEVTPEPEAVTPAAPEPEPAAPAVPEPVVPAAPEPAVSSVPELAAPAVPEPAAPTFTYRPVAPVNGKLKGVVELRASGFNSCIIRVDQQHNWKLEKDEFDNSLVMENMATETDICNGLKKYIGKMTDFGVASQDIHFVVSSEAALAPVTRSIVRALGTLKYGVTTVTPERAGQLSLLAALPPAFADKAFVLDMGPTTSKIVWQANGQTKVAGTYGVKYYKRNTAEAVVTADVAAKAGLVPTGLRSTCFVLGGVPHEWAKAVRQGTEPYTVLEAADAHDQIDNPQAKSGLVIYQAVAAATGCQQFVFGYDANFTIGYLLSLR